MDTQIKIVRGISAITSCLISIHLMGCESELSKNGLDTDSLSGVIIPNCETADDCPSPSPCQPAECNAAGICTYASLNAVVLPSDNACVLKICENGQLSEKVLMDGSECGPNGFCFQGQCHSCDDGQQNGDEYDIDCGGAHCQKCLGDFCSYPTECHSNYCANNTCCNSSCNLSSQQCNFAGECKVALNHPCFIDADCASGLCYGSPNPQVCKLDLWAPCSSNSECFTNYCEFGVYCFLAPPGAPCQFHDQCDFGPCIGGKCQ